ncbi:protein FAM217B-like isoform X2 [Pseudophryne corroboree]|uniref:protein FAM217B-like isoform X2 n=1 Tax=Pseudophryne corroboree TaxID=495146 RepID=UPI003081D756
MLKRKSWSVKSTTAKPDRHHPMKPGRKLETFSHAHKDKHSLQTRRTPEEIVLLDASQPHYKHSVNEKLYTDNPRQLKRVNVRQAKYTVQKVKKESLAECCQCSQLQNDTSTSRTKLQSISKTAETDLLQPVYLSEQQVLAGNLSSRSSHENVKNSVYERESLDKLFLDFESVGFRKEDEDSASDLSDSERLPILPSPIMPPELNLRAEEIKPGYFSHYVEHDCKSYGYPDFLPPPYSSWNLGKVSMFANKEKKNTLQSTASGFLDKYVERLLQLEWLQMLTVQTENAKTAKSRPQTALGMSRNGKSPRKSTSWHSPMPTKQISHSDNISKRISEKAKNDHKQYLQHESSSTTCVRKSSPKPLGTVEIPGEMRHVRKKTLMPHCKQAKDLSIIGIQSDIQSAGNIRPQKQSSLSEKRPKTSKIPQTIYSRAKSIPQTQ